MTILQTAPPDPTSPDFFFFFLKHKLKIVFAFMKHNTIATNPTTAAPTPIIESTATVDKVGDNVGDDSIVGENVG